MSGRYRSMWSIWQFTCATKLYQANGQQNQVRTVFVDNCWKLIAKIQSIFGSNASVKLDLFHAIQRIPQTVPKRHPLSHGCITYLVFRADGDTGEKRMSATPASKISSTTANCRLEDNNSHLLNVHQRNLWNGRADAKKHPSFILSLRTFFKRQQQTK